MRNVVLTACIFIGLHHQAPGQSDLSMPSWLSPYPGAPVETESFPGLLQSTYRMEAKADEIVEHYRKLFVAANVPFRSNFDGVGTTIRGAAPECDLLITVREQTAGVYVRASCSAKAGPSPQPSAPAAIITSNGSVSGTPPSRPARSAMVPARTAGSGLSAQSKAEHDAAAAALTERHKQTVARLGIHPVYQDAPAPALVWPAWLCHMQGAKLQTQKGVDESKDPYLKARFVTATPMSAIHTFYEDLLNANGYRVHTSRLSTGQTLSGIVQNAYGFVAGTNYPNGHPGPRTVIHVSFSRSKLNEPITVDLRITAYDFKAPKRTGF